MAETTAVAEPQKTDFNDSLLDIIASLTPEQEAKVGQLHQKFVATMGVEKLAPSQQEVYKTTRKVLFTKLLLARNWVIDDALNMLQTAADWRINDKIDEIPLFPNSHIPARGYDEKELVRIRGVGERPMPEITSSGNLDESNAQIRKCYSSVWHKWDREGRPVWYERTGQCKVRSLVEACKAATAPGGDIGKILLDLHILSNEVGAACAAYTFEKGFAKHPVTGVTSILDLAGFSLGHLHKPGLDLFTSQTKLDTSRYYEGLHKIFVVNCPSIVATAYALVSPLVPERTKAKVIFLTAEQTKEKLLEEISPENLPKWLGGECECEGGCCPEVPGPPEEEVEFEGGTKEVNIKAGSVEKHETEEVTAGDDVHYHVHIPDHDVIVGVQFHPSPATGTTKAPEPIIIKEPTKMQGEIKEKFSSPTTGKLVVSFDNTFSWLRSKTVAVNTKVDPTAKKEEEEEQEASSSAAAVSSSK